MTQEEKLDAIRAEIHRLVDVRLHACWMMVIK